LAAPFDAGFGAAALEAANVTTSAERQRTARSVRRGLVMTDDLPEWSPRPDRHGESADSTPTSLAPRGFQERLGGDALRALPGTGPAGAHCAPASPRLAARLPTA